MSALTSATAWDKAAPTYPFRFTGPFARDTLKRTIGM